MREPSFSGSESIGTNFPWSLSSRIKATKRSDLRAKINSFSRSFLLNFILSTEANQESASAKLFGRWIFKNIYSEMAFPIYILKAHPIHKLNCFEKYFYQIHLINCFFILSEF